MVKHSIPHFLASFLTSLWLAFILLGFLNPVLDSHLAIVIATLIVMIIANVLIYILLRSMPSSLLRSNPYVLFLPIFFVGVIYICLQFPVMFKWEYISIPQEYLLTFIICSIISGLSSYLFTQKINIETKNGQGIYLGIIFFFIQLILARALNHPALSHNVVLFEADAGPWMEILASPQSSPINRAVHPLSLIIIRPLMRIVSFWMGEHYPLGAMLVVSATAGLCVFMTWLFIKRATESDTYAFLFATLLGFTASHLLFGSLTENYIFGTASLIFFFLLIQAKENRFIFLVPAGLFLFGITITNIVQGVIGLLFSKFNYRRLIQFCVYVLTLGILLTLFTYYLFPRAITLFFNPNDIAFELGFVKVVGETPESSFVEKFQVSARTMGLYGVVAPKPIEAISEKPPFPTIDLKTFDIRTHALASYKGIANIPLGLWLILLAGSFITFIKNFRISKHLPLMLGLLGTLGFNFLMHLFYGTELFLYTPYWIYALVLFIALSLSEYSENAWFHVGLSVIIFIITINNFNFIFSILKVIAPFYSAV